MEISMEARDNLLIARPEGRLDSGTSASFENQLIDQVQTPDGSVIIDFSALHYVSSAGLRSILILAKAAEAAGCKLCLAGLSAEILEIFQTTGFHNIIPIHDLVQDAIKPAE